MRYEEVKTMIVKVDRHLLSMGCNENQIQEYWDYMLKEARQDADKH